MSFVIVNEEQRYYRYTQYCPVEYNVYTQDIKQACVFLKQEEAAKHIEIYLQGEQCSVAERL